MEMVGYWQLSDHFGIRDTRQILQSYDSNQWYRYKNRMKRFNLEQHKVPYFKPVREQLEVFDTVKLVDYIHQM